MWFYLLKKEVHFIKKNYHYTLSYIILSYLLLLISIIIIGNNNEIIRYIGIFIINNNFIVLSIFISSEIININQYRSILRLFVNSNIDINRFLYIKCIINWIFIFLPIIISIILHYFLIDVYNNNILYSFIIYVIYTLILIFINIINKIIITNIKNKIIVFIINQIINLPIIILCANILHLANNELINQFHIIGFILLLILLLLIGPFITAILYHINE